MDINIIPVSGAAQFYSSPVPTTTTDTPVQTEPAYKVQAASIAAQAAEQKSQAASANEYETAKQASAAAPFNYPLGDKEFTIFKDATGKYITRYVSLRDGSVTYTPTPTFVRPISIQA